LSTRWPRTSPSVPSMAMVRTMFSPRCCATSSTRRMLLSSTSSAVRIGGSPSSNRTSTTAPMTWHTCPMAPAPVNSSVVLPVEGAARWASPPGPRQMRRNRRRGSGGIPRGTGGVGAACGGTGTVRRSVGGTRSGGWTRGPGASPWPAARQPDLGFPRNGARGSGGSELRERVVGVWGSGRRIWRRVGRGARGSDSRVDLVLSGPISLGRVWC
jgi:hypothetical protein